MVLHKEIQLVWQTNPIRAKTKGNKSKKEENSHKHWQRNNVKINGLVCTRTNDTSR